jgi:hypothetical protein
MYSSAVCSASRNPADARTNQSYHRAGMPRFVALLRAISNVPMQPFRAQMEALRFASVETFGMSGNILFDTPRTDAASLERRLRRTTVPVMSRPMMNGWGSSMG